VYEAWCHHLAERLLRPALGDELFTHYYGLPAGSGTWRAVVLPALLDDRPVRWFGTGDPADVLRGALDDALDELEGHLGPDPHRWRWEDLHRVTFAGPLAMIPGLEELFTGGALGKGGDDDTIDAGTFEPERRYDAVVVASWRQIQDLSDPDASLGTHTTGQSGHPASPHWNDLLALWAAGGYHPLPTTREAVERHGAGTTTLRPR
jgi:penicillin amidase